MSGGGPNPWRELAESEIQKLVESLNSLWEGELGVTMLVACGLRAIAPLRQFLLEGEPGSVAEPRRRAVRALAELGAVDVLLEYLRRPREIADPVLRFSEEEVVSLAARCVAKRPTEEVRRTLLALAQEHMLPGVAEALGACRLTEGVPYLVRALGNDCARESAEHALRQMGVAARSWLVATALHAEPSREEETPSSVRRRRWAVRLLLEGGASREEWAALQGLVNDADTEVAVTAARLGLAAAPERDRPALIAVLLGCLDSADWLLQSEIADALAAHRATAEPLVRKALESRRERASAAPGPGSALLRRVLGGSEPRHA